MTQTPEDLNPLLPEPLPDAEAEVVGGDLVKSWGGEVRLAPIVEGYSTTAAIARMSKSA